MRQIALIIVLSIMSACGSNLESSSLTGDFRTSHVEDSYHLFESNFIWQDLRKTTDLWSKTWPNKSLTRNQLSWKIYAISECLDIDPIVFSSLIYSESAFKISAVSRTKSSWFNSIYKYWYS